MPQPSPTGSVPRRRPAPARRKGAVWAAALRALVSVVVLAALLGGLPVLLWFGTVIVAPAGIQALGSLLTTQDSGEVFLLALAVVGWIGWGLFAAAVLVEIPAQLRGHTAPQLRLLIGQKTAAALVGAILLALPTGTALASSAAPAQAAPMVTATALPATDTSGGQGQAVAASVHGSDGTLAYTVRSTRPAESLWSIAQARLGDGNRWEEIADLNNSRTMGDGQVFHADAPIQPGWTLRLPGDATSTDTSAANSTGSTPTGTHADGGHSGRAIEGDDADYTVRPGDTLSQIAEDELGNASKYPEIFQLNEGEAQPGGRHFTNPDLIYPGQNLDLPSTHATTGGGSGDRGDTPRTSGADNGASTTQHEEGEQEQTASPTTPEATASPSTAGPSASASTDASSSDGAGGAQPSPSESAPAQTAPSTAASGPTSSGEPTSWPQTPAPTATSSALTSADDGSDDAMQPAVLAAGIGALLAACLAGALGVKRILAQRRRRAGETIAIDADPTLVEQVLNATSEPAGVALLDTVLRTLAHHADTAGRDVPVVRGARVTDRSVQLVLDDPATELLPPFAAGRTPGTWVVDPACPLLPEDAARQVPAPYPGLVTLGATEDGDLLLANLLHGGALLLDGNPNDVLAVARAMALEAGTSGWTDHTEIVTVGLGARLATLLPQGRVRTMPHLPSVVADLGALLVEVHQQQGGGPEVPEPLPWILICAGDVDAQQAWQLADAVSAARGLPVAVVLPAGDATRQAFPDAEQIPVAPDTQVTLAQLGAGPVQLQRLTDEQYRQYVHALDVADQPAQPATGAWQLAEDHGHAATTPRPGPHPLLLHHGENNEATDPGSPFPALLATSTPIRLFKATADVSDGAGEVPAPSAAAAGPDPEPTPGGSGEEVPLAEQAPGGEAVGEGDPDAPQIDVLGPIRVTGITGSGHGPKVRALAALIYLRPGRSAESLCTAMDPVSPWSTRTLQSRLSEIRSRFGAAADGEAYLPRPQHGGYAFHAGVHSDWATFQHLATRGLAAGPEAGIPDLENALGLVRGRPFEGGDFPWADSVQHEMLSRIVDVAHTLAAWHTDGDSPDLDAARHAALRGLDIDETAEVLYRDWMTIEWAAENTAGIRKAVARVQQVARSYDMSLDTITEQTIDLVTSPDRTEPAHAGRA